ncbi:hypothetical protein, partial [Rhizobium leguminosarum]|uniref:hypothetical protein n=1 Tax=Rhizobium leguminosarum TaxID=384 RepID=UPI003F9B2A6D
MIGVIFLLSTTSSPPYHTVKLQKNLKLTPDLPKETVVAHTIKTELTGITLGHVTVTLEPANDW